MSKKRTGTNSRGSGGGTIVIISSPSGGGKTSICRALLSPDRRRKGWIFSLSYTTRTQRSGERNGREYHFVSDEQFDSLVRKDFFAEHFRVHQFKYGTPRKPLEVVLRKGSVMLVDVDVKGAGRLRKEFPEALTIFILPPSVAAFKRRLRKRGTETAQQLQIRFETARREMASFRKYGFEYVVVNKELKEAVGQVLAIITADRCRIDSLAPERLKRIMSLTK